MERTDVVVVGAGLAGASLAWHLAGRRKTLVLEQDEQPCSESSAQNAGMVRRLVPAAEERELACRSHAHLVDLPDGGRDWDESPPFRRTGAVIALAERDDAGLLAAAEDLRRRGIAVEDLSGDALSAVAPALEGALLRNAFWLPDEGVCDAWSLGRGFLAGATRRGAELRCGVHVEALSVEGGRVVGVVTDRGAIGADLVVLANGAWSRRLARSAGLDRPLTPLARHLFVSSQHPISHRDHPWCWIDDAGIYVRPEAGAFLCSPCDETEREPDDGPGSARTPEAWWRAVAQDKLSRHFPALAGLRLCSGWVGLRTFAPDRHAVVGLDPEIEGLGWLAGLGGFGVSCAFALGERAAAAILSGECAAIAMAPAANEDAP